MLDGYADPDKHYDLTVLSLGAGVQSTALLLMPLRDIDFTRGGQMEFDLFGDGCEGGYCGL